MPFGCGGFFVGEAPYGAPAAPLRVRRSRRLRLSTGQPVLVHPHVKVGQRQALIPETPVCHLAAGVSSCWGGPFRGPAVPLRARRSHRLRLSTGQTILVRPHGTSRSTPGSHSENPRMPFGCGGSSLPAGIRWFHQLRGSGFSPTARDPRRDRSARQDGLSGGSRTDGHVDRLPLVEYPHNPCRNI